MTCVWITTMCTFRWEKINPLLLILGEMDDCDMVSSAACTSQAPSPQLPAGVFNLPTLSGCEGNNNLNSPESHLAAAKWFLTHRSLLICFLYEFLFSDVIKSPAKWISGLGCVRLKCYWISVLCGIARDQAKWFCLVVIVTACCVRSFFVFLWLSYRLCHSFTFRSI